MRGSASTLRYALKWAATTPTASPTTSCCRSRPVVTLGGGTRAVSGSELAVDGAEVSALHRAAACSSSGSSTPRRATVVTFPGRRVGWSTCGATR